MNDQYLSIINATYLADYKIEFVFNDGKKQCVDFEAFLSKSQHPEIRKYLDKSLFSKFTLDFGEIYWNDYDLVFPIADIYSNDILRKKADLNAS